MEQQGQDNWRCPPCRGRQDVPESQCDPQPEHGFAADQAGPVDADVLEESGLPAPDLLAQKMNGCGICCPGDRSGDVNSLAAGNLLGPGVVHVLHDGPLGKAAELRQGRSPERSTAPRADDRSVGHVLHRPVEVKAKQVFDGPSALRDGPGDLGLHVARRHHHAWVAERNGDALDVVIGQHCVSVDRQHEVGSAMGERIVLRPRLAAQVPGRPEHLGTVVACDLTRPVGGAVIHDYDPVRPDRLPQDRIQSVPDARLLIECRDNDGNRWTESLLSSRLSLFSGNLVNLCREGHPHFFLFGEITGRLAPFEGTGLCFLIGIHDQMYEYWSVDPR